MAQVRSGSPRVVDDARMQLAGVADDEVVEHELGASPGMPRRLVAAANGQLGPGSPGEDAGRLDRVGPVGRAPGPPPARAVALTGQHDGDVPRLIAAGPPRAPPAPHPTAGARRPAAARRERPGAGGTPVRSRTGASSRRPRPRLRVSVASSPRQQRGAQLGFGVRERVGDDAARAGAGRRRPGRTGRCTDGETNG